MARFGRVAVIGSGTMGRGIALATVEAGLQATLQDKRPDALKEGLSWIGQRLDRAVASGTSTAPQRAAASARLRGVPTIAEAVRDADLVVETVFEDLEIKRAVMRAADEHAPPEAVLATNTSSLRVSDLAAATNRPARVLGLHFFFPAHRNALVEVVPTSGTPREVLQAGMAYVRGLGKVPIRTGDSPGFCVNRFFVPWVNEAVRLVDDGVANVPTVEAAAKAAFGIKLGPFELMNATGPQISLNAIRTLHAAFGSYYEPAEGLVRHVEQDKKPWALDGTVDPSRFPAVEEHLTGVAWGIASRLVEEGVATAVDTDKGAVVGLQWRRGPFAMMSATGLKDALQRIEGLNAAWGDSFPVSQALRAHAGAGEPWALPRVRVDRENSIAIVTIQRPEALNALNTEVLRHLLEALGGLEDVRAAVITGEGTAFVAGADVREMAKMGTQEALEFTRLGHEVMRAIEDLPIPVVAAVNGYALGGGLELALACDVRVVAEEAVVGLPEVTLGIIPGFGGTTRLPRVIGPERARLLVFSGRRLSGPEARAWGLAHVCVPRADVLDAARELALQMSGNAPLAVAAAKRAMVRTADAPLPDALAMEIEEVSRLFATSDKGEGLRAFLDKRKPEWKDE